MPLLWTGRPREMYIRQASMVERGNSTDLDYEYMGFCKVESKAPVCKDEVPAAQDEEPDYVPMEGALNDSHVLARALYDNQAEAPDELSFRKGDIVTVLEQNTSGLEGWWLCSLNGRQGIAPGNRLKLLAGMYETPHSPPPSQTAQKIKTPQRIGQSYLYDSPSGLRSANRQDDYDVPPVRGTGYSQQSLRYGTVPGAARSPLTHQVSAGDTYDVPPGLQQSSSKSPSPPPTSPPTSEVYDSPAGLRKPSANELYDSPKLQQQFLQQQQPQQQQQQQQQQETYDVLPAGNKEIRGAAEPHSLPQIKVDSKGVESPPKSPTDVYDVPSSQQVGPRTAAVRQLSSPEKTAAIRQLSSPEKTTAAPLSNGSNSIDLYDTLPGSGQRGYPTDVYDVPPMHDAQSAKRPSLLGDGKMGGEELHSSPSSSAADATTAMTTQGLYDSPSKTRTTTADEGTYDHVYDIPPQVSRDQPRSGGASPVHQRGGSVDSADAKMSLLSMSRLTKSADGLDEPLPGGGRGPDVASALDSLTERQQVLETAVAYLMSYVSSTWRHQSNLEPRIHEIRSACRQLKLALEEFLEFAQACAAAAGAGRHAEEPWAGKLATAVQSMRESHAAMLRSHAALDDMNWLVAKLVYRPGTSQANDLDQIALSARSVAEDLKRFVALVQENAAALFRPSSSSSSSSSSGRNLTSPQERPLPMPPPSAANANWLSPEKEVASKGTIQSRPLPQLPPTGAPPTGAPPTGTPGHQPDDLDRTPNNKEGLADYGFLTKRDPLVSKQIIVTDPAGKTPSVLPPADKQILAFYVADVESLVNSMGSAIEVFFTCIEANQPPKVFVAHSKQIILIGHRLVFIGDTLHHNLQHPEVRARIIRCSDSLCDWLNGAVNTTKAAALQYPAVAPLQEMVDRITDAANATQDLKAAILQCAAL